MTPKKILIIVIIASAVILSVIYILFQGKLFQQPANFPNVQQQEKEKVIFNVSIENYAFSPKEAEIKTGTTVVWTNKDPISHSVKLAGVQSQELETGQSFEYTFAMPGEYVYYCGLHPSMQGTITVED
ncbi:MAG: cupredoxin domain-containing protein [Candidatus Pacebacteria bacterium]|nr:cupredoxin domain-containing protein [Candidatus Paceibacterota bacterium]